MKKTFLLFFILALCTQMKAQQPKVVNLPLSRPNKPASLVIPKVIELQLKQPLKPEKKSTESNTPKNEKSVQMKASKSSGLELFFTGLTSNILLSIHDSNGTLLKSEKITNTSPSFNYTTDLPRTMNNIYIVYIYSTEYQSRQKVIIK